MADVCNDENAINNVKDKTVVLRIKRKIVENESSNKRHCVSLVDQEKQCLLRGMETLTATMVPEINNEIFKRDPNAPIPFNYVVKANLGVSILNTELSAHFPNVEFKPGSFAAGTQRELDGHTTNQIFSSSRIVNVGASSMYYSIIGIQNLRKDLMTIGYMPSLIELMLVNEVHRAGMSHGINLQSLSNKPELRGKICYEPKGFPAAILHIMIDGVRRTCEIYENKIVIVGSCGLDVCDNIYNTIKPILSEVPDNSNSGPPQKKHARRLAASQFYVKYKSYITHLDILQEYALMIQDGNFVFDFEKLVESS